jgi:hypothetical protein
MSLEDILAALAPYVPFFQTVIWALAIVSVGLLLKRQIRMLLEAVTDRLKEGSPVKVGGIELGAGKVVTRTADLAKDEVKVFGNPDRFQLLFKATSSTWSKSTKAMQVPNGCIVQVTTERRNLDGTWAHAEALTFVPGAVVVEEPEGNGRCLGSPEKP